MPDTDELRTCAQCGDEVSYLSSRDWCDACETDVAPQATTHHDTMNHSHPRWATREQAARYIGVHVNTIDKWRAEGRLRTHRAGPRLVRFDLNEIDAMLCATPPMSPGDTREDTRQEVVS